MLPVVLLGLCLTSLMRSYSNLNRSRSMQTIAFTSVRLPFGWLGNMAPFPIEADGVTWRTSEALFQARRFGNDISIRELIRAEKSPMAAKMVAKRHHLLMKIVPQSPEDLAMMAEVLKLKIEQHPDLKAQLIATADSLIIEDCSNRPRGSGLFWGAALQPDGNWLGENTLGKLWMALRASVSITP